MGNSSNEQPAIATSPATVAPPPELDLAGAAGLPRPEQVSLVCAHQQERWQRGERALLEEYLEQLPALRDDADALLYLVMHEVSLRDERRETPGVDEYLKRFPILAAGLRREFELRWATAVRTAGGGDVATVPPAWPTMDEGDVRPAHPKRPSVIGYEILGELGRGGMGVVYKARQEGLNRVVALKMVLAAEHASVEGLARFRIEAEAVARLQHPNIVQIHEVGAQDGRPFFSLEFVDGGSLEDKLKGGPQAPRQAALLIEQLARAMQYAHEHNIIHRDLKPANVLLTAEGTPKVTDFGLAKRMDTQGQTQSGDIMGTPSYMAPEQAASAPDIGPPADIYALGAILYDQLVGRPPFQAATAMDTILQVLKEEPVPPRRLQSKVPRDLETICLKCLEKKPHKRYASAAALADDIHRYLEGEPIQARPAGTGERLIKWVRRRPTLAALIAACILIAVTLVGGGIWSNRALAAAARAEAARATEAEDAKHQAEKALAESRSRMVRIQVQSGMAWADNGYLFYALPWLAEALRLEKQDPDQEISGRMRLGTLLRGCPATIQLWLHDGPVTDLAFSPDGKQIATSAQRMARIWDVNSGAQVGSPLTHNDVVKRVAFSPNGKYVITASEDKTARIWDAASKKLHVLPHQGPVVQACFSPDSRHALTASGHVAQVWDVATGERAGMPLEHAAAVTAVAFSRDGLRVLTCSNDKTAQIWNALTGKAVDAPLRHPGEVFGAAYSPDDLHVATASTDGARLWDIKTGQQIHRLVDKVAPVGLVAFSPDGRRLLTTSRNEARVWDTETGKQLPFTVKQRSTIHDAVFSADGRQLATGGDDNIAQVADAGTGALLLPPLPHSGDVRRVALSPDGRFVATACDDGLVRLRTTQVPPPSLVLRHEAEVKHVTFRNGGKHILTADKGNSIHVWDAERGQPLTSWKSEQPLGFVAFSPDGQWTAAVDTEGGARVRETSSGKAVSPPLLHRGKVNHLDFSPDGARLVTASADHTACVWDSRTGASLTPALQHDGRVNRATFSPDGRLVVTASADKAARVWDAASGKLLLPLLGHQGEVYWASWSPDGKRIVTASEDSTALVWDARTGQPLTPPLLHPSRTFEAFFSSDGGRVITASDDNVARIWDVVSGKLAAPAMHHEGRINHAHFSPDNRWALTASDEAVARVWDSAKGLPLTPYLRHEGPVADAAFSPDGRRVATASVDGTVRVWQLVPDQRPLDDLLSMSRLYCEAEIDATGGANAMSAQEVLRSWLELRKKYPKEFAPPR